MALSYKARRRWALIILLIGLPVYIVVAVTLADWLRANVYDGPQILIELIVFVVLGILWIVPLKPIFKGVGQADPDADKRGE